MSRHRSADTTLTLTPLAQRLEELSRQAANEADADPRFAELHKHIEAVTGVVQQALVVITDQYDELQSGYAAGAQTRIERSGSRDDHSPVDRDSIVAALAAHLADRDAAREAERDRVLRDVLEDFATSLHARERRTLARRLIDAVDRRRDARDAARWRSEHTPAGRPQATAGIEPSTGQELVSRVIDLEAAAKSRRASSRR